MKKHVHDRRKLALRTETVRALKTLDLTMVAGGQVTTTVLSAEITKCPTDDKC